MQEPPYSPRLYLLATPVGFFVGRFDRSCLSFCRVSVHVMRAALHKQRLRKVPQALKHARDFLAFACSPYELTKQVARAETWTPTEINERQRTLADLAVK